MLHGDFATFPLPDLLQWLDVSRRGGILEVQGTPALWLRIEERQVVEAGPAPSARGLQPLARWQPSLPAETLWPEALVDSIYDLFVYGEQGSFSLFEAGADFEEGVPLQDPLGELVLEGLRRLDEQARLEATYPDESAVLKAEARPPEMRPGLLAVVEAARAELSIAEARLALGLSRPAILRRLEGLRDRGVVSVAGVNGRPDPVAALIGKAQLLVREGQYDEAALVLGTILAADPPHERVRRLLRELEREQVASLYAEMSPLAVPVPASKDVPAKLGTAEREVLGRINGRLGVGSLTLASPLREVETLKALRNLIRLGLVALG